MKEVDILKQIELNTCWLCDITNYKNNRDKKQSTIILEDKHFCKYHYKIAKEVYNTSSDKMLESLIKEGQRLKLKYNL